MPRAQRLSGTAAREIVRPGTAGEYNAVVLRLKNGGRVILQRRGGNPFNDPATSRLVGHAVRVKGFRLGEVFRFTEAEVIDR
jgi:hypothetical protein